MNKVLRLIQRVRNSVGLFKDSDCNVQWIFNFLDRRAFDGLMKDGGFVDILQLQLLVDE